VNAVAKQTNRIVTPATRIEPWERLNAPLAMRQRALSPQLAKTLALLARGLNEREAAAELGLSQHTVHEYVQTLYRRFGVRTRAQLLARIIGHYIGQ
jgi:DNA-binding NarL/FixJ family response regulator